MRLGIQRSLSKTVDFIRRLSADPLLIPEFTIRYTHLKLSKVLLPITNRLHAKEKLDEIEFSYNRFQEITKRGRKYGTEMPPRPMGLGVLFAFILILFYLVFYLLR
jgi:phosphomevalonate kinase